MLLPLVSVWLEVVSVIDRARGNFPTIKTFTLLTIIAPLHVFGYPVLLHPTRTREIPVGITLRHFSWTLVQLPYFWSFRGKINWVEELSVAFSNLAVPATLTMEIIIVLLGYVVEVFLACRGRKTAADSTRNFLEMHLRRCKLRPPLYSTYRRLYSLRLELVDGVSGWF